MSETTSQHPNPQEAVKPDLIFDAIATDTKGYEAVQLPYDEWAPLNTREPLPDLPGVGRVMAVVGVSDKDAIVVMDMRGPDDSAPEERPGMLSGLQVFDAHNFDPTTKQGTSVLKFGKDLVVSEGGRFGYNAEDPGRLATFRFQDGVLSMKPERLSGATVWRKTPEVSPDSDMARILQGFGRDPEAPTSEDIEAVQLYLNAQARYDEVGGDRSGLDDVIARVKKHFGVQ